ncbi:putative retroelement [Abeliophyllum distichum]|uniref:Retroelement n=1 Tax=Abeliophyllum distichum TaxID=126358 RepID=A0ABD1V516_9LAMI
MGRSFLQGFKTARSKCFVPLPEKEFVKIAQSCLSIDLKKKFHDREFPDLFELSANMIRYERFIREEEQMKNSSKGTYYRDPNFDVHIVDEYYDQTKVYLAELVKGDVYACPLMAKLGTSDAIELGRITFEAKKKMTVDENPFPHPLGIKLVTTGFKGGMPKFKLVVDDGEEDHEPHPSVFGRLKGKEVRSDEGILCARCKRELNENVEKIRTWGHHHRPSIVPNFQLIGGRGIYLWKTTF